MAWGGSAERSEVETVPGPAATAVSSKPAPADDIESVSSEAGDRVKPDSTGNWPKPSHALLTDCYELTAALLANQQRRHAFASAPLPLKGGALRATIKRTRCSLLAGHGHRYSLYGELPNGQLVFILAAEKQVAKCAVGPYYLLSSNEILFDRTSEHFLGRLQGNALCTQYILHGRGQDPRKLQPGLAGEADFREELAAVRFRKPTDAPRSMQVAVPLVVADGSRQELRPVDPRHDGLARAWGARGDQKEGGSCGGDAEAAPWVRLASPAPRWDPVRKVYSLDFHGRVKRTSSKNFQLTAVDRNFRPLGTHETELSMQFGRVSEDVFSIDIGFPLSPVQALAISMSTFDARITETLRMYY